MVLDTAPALGWYTSLHIGPSKCLCQRLNLCTLAAQGGHKHMYLPQIVKKPFVENHAETVECAQSLTTAHVFQAGQEKHVKQMLTNVQEEDMGVNRIVSTRLDHTCACVKMVLFFKQTGEAVKKMKSRRILKTLQS